MCLNVLPCRHQRKWQETYAIWCINSLMFYCCFSALTEQAMASDVTSSIALTDQGSIGCEGIFFLLIIYPIIHHI